MERPPSVVRTKQCTIGNLPVGCAGEWRRAKLERVDEHGDRERETEQQILISADGRSRPL